MYTTPTWRYWWNSAFLGWRYTEFFSSICSGWRAEASPKEAAVIRALRKVWPILLCVYLVNAFFVDMAYQFVIGLLFTVAGMLCATEEVAA